MNKKITILLTTVLFFTVFLTNLFPYIPKTVLAATKTSDETSYENNAKVLIDLLSIFLNIGTTENGSTTTNTSLTIASPTASLTPSLINSGAGTTSEGYVYYAQSVGEFADYPLASGCTIKAMGCGPTTVAMIIASYVDKSVTPKTIVDLYKQRGYYLSCNDGTYISDAKALLNSYGLQTADYMNYNYATSDSVVKDFKNYLNGGYTILALASFGSLGNDKLKHFFWITKIDEKNNIWAYDPYYGVGQTLPYNENSRYPFPKYLWAFAVKK